jgi:HK97 family phage major capsid protein
MAAPTLPDLIKATEHGLRSAERRRNAATDALKTMVARAKAQGREHLTVTETTEADRLGAERSRASEEFKELSAKMVTLREVEADEARIEADQQTRDPYYKVILPGQRDSSRPTWVRSIDRRPATVERGQRFADHPVVAEHAARRAQQEHAVVGMHGGIGNLIRSMSTTTGSAIVPTIWASDIIDRARNYAAVIQAGAEVVPMDALTVQIGRLTADPTAAFRAEGSTVNASDPTFDNVTLTAKTMSTLVVGSMEWFQDGIDTEEIVTNAIAKALALQLDYAALFGGVTSGGEGINLATPPNPRGVLATLLAVASSSVLGSGANGTAQTAASWWREVQQTLFTPLSFNERPNGILWNSKLFQQYIDAYDTTNQPLRMPENIAAVPQYVTNQIPSFTQGTMTNRATDLFIGDWTQLIIGQRLELTVQTLTERYAELGQVGIIAHWRGDVAPARPRAFAVYRYLQGA